LRAASQKSENSVAIFERQSPAVQDGISAAVTDEARAFATPGGVEIPNAAHLATAVKPKS
jgi:hypothetical protein